MRTATAVVILAAMVYYLANHFDGQPAILTAIGALSLVLILPRDARAPYGKLDEFLIAFVMTVVVGLLISLAWDFREEILYFFKGAPGTYAALEHGLSRPA